MNVRRVVTGHDESGRSVFASDEQVDPIVLDRCSPAGSSTRSGAATARPHSRTTAASRRGRRTSRRSTAFRFSLSTIPPAGLEPAEGLDLDGRRPQVERDDARADGTLEPDDPGMHTTDTIDLEVILSGEVVLELDDGGAERVLRAGDIVVQNGTRHRWLNRRAEPAVMAVFMLGARRIDGLRAGTCGIDNEPPPGAATRRGGRRSIAGQGSCACCGPNRSVGGEHGPSRRQGRRYHRGQQRHRARDDGACSAREGAKVVGTGRNVRTSTPG